MEIPSQEWLVSLFLEDLCNKELHSTIYMKHLIDLDQCIYEAIEYDDNFSKVAASIGSQIDESTARVSSQVDEIVQGVKKRMPNMYGPPRVVEKCMDWLYICGVCGKKRPTWQCIPKNQGMVRLEPQ